MHCGEQGNLPYIDVTYLPNESCLAALRNKYSNRNQFDQSKDCINVLLQTVPPQINAIEWIFDSRSAYMKSGFVVLKLQKTCRTTLNDVPVNSSRSNIRWIHRNSNFAETNFLDFSHVHEVKVISVDTGGMALYTVEWTPEDPITDR
eukprot:sb/3473787/